jgi:thiol-disulfide isomerase/thioredoxin
MRRLYFILVLLCAATARAAASPIPPTEVIPLLPAATWKVEIDGSEVRSAEIYGGEGLGLLILGCSMKDPLLVAPSDRTVRYIPQGNVLRDDEGNVSMRGSPSEPICVYKVNGTQITFQAEGRMVRLSPRAPLVGKQTLEAIIEHSPDYETRIKSYKPDGAAVSYLSKYTRKTDILIYFGSWCPHCEAWVPRLVKALQSASNDSLSTQFVALPRNFASDADARSWGIQGVPTIIVIQGGREVGRLVGPPEAGTIESALVKVLEKVGG